MASHCLLMWKKEMQQKQNLHLEGKNRHREPLGHQCSVGRGIIEGAGKGEADLKDVIRHNLKRLLPWLIFSASLVFSCFEASHCI